MKKNLLKSEPFLACFTALLVIANFYPKNAVGQSYKKRTYANFQGTHRTGTFALGNPTIIGTVTNPTLAADTDPRTASSLDISLGLAAATTVTQFLEFTTTGNHSTVRNIAAGTTVSVKFKVPSSLLGLLGGIEIGSYTGLNSVTQSVSGFAGTGTGYTAGHNATSRYPAYTGTTLLNALNGAGELELSFAPSQIYNGIYIRLSAGALSLGLTTQLFHAYILEDAPLNCSVINSVVDVLSGVKGNSVVNAVSATGTVTSPWNAVDDDPLFTTYSTLSTGAQVLSNVFETVIFETPSQPGDSIKIVLQDPGGGLLSVAALKGFTIQAYLGNTAVGSPITNIASALSLRLLSGSSDKYELSVAMPVSFDRIEITMGGVTDALAQLRVYDIDRIIAAPAINQNTTNVTNDTVYVYYGNSTGLSATSNISDSIKWYDEDGQWLANGGSYLIPSVIEEGLYYAESTRSGCSQTSSMHSVYVKLLAVQMLPMPIKRASSNKEASKNIASVSIQNPVFDKMMIQFSEMKKGDYRIEFRSIDGHLVYSNQLFINNQRQSETILRPYQTMPGLYIVCLYNARHERLYSFKILFK